MWKNQFPTKKRFYEEENGILYCADSLNLLKDFPSNSVDLVVTDPPYNSKAFGWDNKWDFWQTVWLEEVKRIMKQGASLYVFFSPMNMLNILHWINENLTLKNILVWHHKNLYGAGLSFGTDRWKSSWDAIIYAVKGSKAKHNKKLSTYAYEKYGNSMDVLIEPQPRPLHHKAEKPLKILTKLIDCSSNTNDIILDPFVGSGTTLIASKVLKRKWIGIEIDEDYCKITKQRLAKTESIENVIEWF